MMSDITINAAPLETIHVILVDKEYDILPPKTALAMRLAVDAKLHQDDVNRLQRSALIVMSDIISPSRFGHSQGIGQLRKTQSRS